MHRRIAAILLITLAAHACAFADTIWVGAAPASALEMKSVTVTGMADGKLLFQSAGRDASRDLATVLRILIEDEPAFSAAEEAFAAGKLDLAASGYRTALNSTRKPFLKGRIESRLQKLPGAPIAQRPVAAATPRQSAAPTAPVAPVESAAVKQKLDAAAAALQRKDFAAAINEINASKAIFTDPQSQAQALYHLADAHAGVAATKSETAAWQDAALAYMRVAAHFPQNPLAPRALLQTAQIEQRKLSDPAAARLLYQQIVHQHPNDPSAATAKEQLR